MVTRVRRAVLAGLAVAPLACLQPGVYVCEGEGSCDAGRCEANGYCSYVDESCDAGRRYSKLAGDGLAGICLDPIDEPDTTGTGDPSASESSSGGGEDAPSRETSGDGMPECGNGVVEADEDCDDGNDLAGDGCTPQCRISGTPVWQVLEPGDAELDDTARAVALLASGDLVVAGWWQTDADSAVGFYARYDESSGDRQWRNTYDSDSPYDDAHGITVNPANDIVVGGSSGTTAGGGQGWAHLVQPDGNVVHAALPNLATVRSIAPYNGGAALAGTGDHELGGQGGVLLVVNEDLEPLVRREWTQPGSFVATAALAGPEFVVVANRSDDALLLRVSLGEIVELDEFGGRFGGQDRGQAVAVWQGGPAIAMGGFSTTPSAHDWMVRSYDTDGSLGWSVVESELVSAVDDEIEGVAFAPDGTLYATGFITRKDKDIIVVAFDPEGQERWRAVLPEDNHGDDVGRGVVVSPTGALFVVGENTQGGDRDAWIARLEP